MALNAALIPKSAWGRLIYTSLVALLVNDIINRTFTPLFPDLSALIRETVPRLLPSAFITGSILPVVIAAALAVLVTVDVMRRAQRPGMPPNHRRATMWTIVVLLVFAGIGLIDARLSATSTHRTEASDR